MSEENWSIISDSLSSLQSIIDSSCRSPTVNKIQQTLTLAANQGKKISLFWIKAHAGHEGNEKADELAKQGSKTGHQIHISPPFSWVKRYLKTQYHKKWACHCKAWITSLTKDKADSRTENPTITRFFCSPVEVINLRKNIKWTACFTWLLSGHGPMASYLRRFKIRENESCWCRAPVQDSRHLIFECDEPKLSKTRLSLRNKMKRFENYPDIIIAGNNHPVLLTNLFDQIHELLSKSTNESKKPTKFNDCPR